MYGRIIDGKLELLHLPLRSDGIDIFTTDGNIIAEYGYKPIIKNEKPSNCGVKVITANENSIIISWTASDEESRVDTMITVNEPI